MRKRRTLAVMGTHFKTDSANLIVVLMAITVVGITVVATPPTPTTLAIANGATIGTTVITGDAQGAGRKTPPPFFESCSGCASVRPV
jgi:hypothetical protein